MRLLYHALTLSGFVASVSFPAHAIKNGMERSQSPFSVKQESGGWSIQYSRPTLEARTIKIEGLPHLLFTLPTLSAVSDSGSPQLPMETVNLGIPPDAEVSVEIGDQVYEQRPNQFVAPVPRHRKSRNGDMESFYIKDRDAYNTNKFLPGKEIWYDRAFVLRGQRISAIHMAPVQYNPATGLLRRLVRATLRVRMHALGGRAAAPGVARSARDPFFEDVFRGLLANYDQAKQWRSPVSGPKGSAVDSTRNWFQTGKSYFRIPVALDGWYRLTPTDLGAGGATSGTFDPTTVRIINRGADIPVLVRPDSTIEFYGLRKYGDSTYFDYWTDTNVYWLTWGGSPGPRYAPVASLSDTNTVGVLSVPVTKHFEQNTTFYHGATPTEITTPGPLPGKDWVWEYYYPNTTMQHAFFIDSIDAASRPVSTLRVRLYGTTTGSPPVSHHAKFWINDSLVGEIYFGQRQLAIFAGTFPTSWIRNDTNIVTIQSVDTQTSPNQFYMDWFEIDYQRYLLATSNELAFFVQGTGISHTEKFVVGGFTDPTIDIFDLSGNRQITGGQVSGNSTTGYTIAFRDTVSTSRKYVAVCSPGRLSVPPLRQKVFSDLRNNPAGADYIIVTHTFFLTAARRLAAARQSTNGVRTFIATIQDICDEFNYGIFNGEKIKSFLMYAYRTWQAPAPAYLLLFGDASYDDHHYFSYTTKVDYVPTWGVPSSDNWFGCFDSMYDFNSSLMIGRLSFEDSLAADKMVTKVTGYDKYTLGDWNKKFLFIAGGLSTGEQTSFDALSDQTSNTYVSPSPLGGHTLGVYKTNQDIIDSTNRMILQGIVNNGVVLVNFLGHAAGQIWEVDIGNPDDLQNTNGSLPFVSSVSCNAGGFADQQVNTLAEEFTRADNRGAIAFWGAVSLGYAYQGTVLVNHFLSSVAVDSVRSFGALTTSARYGLFLDTGLDPVTIEMIELTPLLGDPLSRLAIPLLPDLALGAQDITVTPPLTSVTDTSATIDVTVHNYGLVPSDSVAISLVDSYNGQPASSPSTVKIPPTRYTDSIAIAWRGTKIAGSHTLQITIDPSDLVPEVSKTNNAASINQYVYGDLLYLVRPLENMVVPPGPQILRVTNPIGADSVSIQVEFEVDTVGTFLSPFMAYSGPITPGPVTAEWSTPPLADGHVYFWRVRTITSSAAGTWETFSFSTSSTLPTAPLVRWRENTKAQFGEGVPSQTAATDSGVIVGSITPLSLFVRSLGNRANQNQGYYSIVRANGQTLTGDWTLYGTGYIGVRVSDVTGAAAFKAFDTPGSSAESDSMLNFITSAAAGSYIGLSVITDGFTNVSSSLRNALKSIGSTMIDSVKPGYAWSMIARIGGGMIPIEHWSPFGTTADSLQVTNYSWYGSGTFGGSLLPMPQRWQSFNWSNGGAAGTTDAKVSLLGIRSNASVDTLRTLPRDSTVTDLSGLNPVTADPAYVGFRALALLTTKVVNISPVLRDWSADFVPPADLAISSHTLSSLKTTQQGSGGNTLNLTIYNIGYIRSDSSRVALSVLQTDNSFRAIAYSMVDSIPAGGYRTLQIPFLSGGLPQQATLQVRVSPPAGSKELIWDNNTALIRVAISPAEPLSAKMHVFADGVQLMDGDYVGTHPKILVHLYDLGGVGSIPPEVDLFVDNVQVGNPLAIQTGKTPLVLARSLDDPTFTPVLANGTHDLRVRVSQQNGSGTLDTVVQDMTLNVTDQYKILEMFNYPDPFSSETWFTFVLTGSAPPDELTIRVYTAAGRKIREIKASPGSLQVGFNRVYWDGRDAQGDEIANGFYLYQVQINGGGKSLIATGKLARVR